MKHICTYLLSAVLLLLAYIGNAQEIKHFDIDIYKDLPSNNVYNLTVDHLGYLWMATDKGVVKYNGYNLTTFDLNKDFINKDTWNLYEDKSGRMWLFNISDNLTYIYNNEAHNIKMTASLGVFYPRIVADYKDGVAVIASFNNGSVSFCFIRNDSLIYAHSILDYGKLVKINSKNQLICYDSTGAFCAVDITEKGVKSTKYGAVVYNEQHELLYDLIETERRSAAGNCITSYTYNKNHINTINAQLLQYKKLTFEKEGNIKVLYSAKGQITAITDSEVIHFDDDFNIKNKYNIRSVLGAAPGENIAFVLDDSTWKKAYATSTNGVHLVTGRDAYVATGTSVLEHAKCLGYLSDSVSFWFNGANSTLYKLANKKIIAQNQLSITEANKILYLNKDYSLLFNNLYIYTLNNNTLEISDPSHGYGGKDALKYGENVVLQISNNRGFIYSTIKNNKIDISTPIERNRFNGIAYDSVRQLVVLYNNRKIILFKNNKVQLSIERKDLEAREINNIEHILFDNKYGNIIIQEGERIISFSDPLKPYHQLFKNLILNDAKVCIHKDVLIACGTFGILFSKINGPGAFSAPIIYPNTKGLKYKLVYSIDVAGNTALLKTDKGVFEIAMPPAEAYNAAQNNYFFQNRFIVTNNNNIYNITRNDTINLVRRNRKLLFDIIKPTGYGKIRYEYQIDDEQTVWTDLNNDELTLPRLSPGKYYTLSIIAYDKQWRSDVKKITIYIAPEWWEEPLFKRIIWVGGLLALLGIIYAIIVVTKKMADRKNVQRNLKLELELKSVYSQINPHFIFNSLTASMYLIKTGKLDEAYEHIYKFSHLLRAYIKSSRNRLISLSDEIKNLTNYIELQQARFKNKFDYEINVDESVNTNLSIPSLLIQPIVENAISHGLLHRIQKGRLALSFSMNLANDTLICKIEDDGIGREQAKSINVDNTLKEESYGNELIKDLINTFNKYEKMKIEIEYLDKQLPLTGTIVMLRIKQLN